MNPETIAKLAQVLLSHRIAANVVLGFAILVGTAVAVLTRLDWQATLAHVPALEASPVVLVILLFLIVVSYSIASLLIGSAISIHRSIKRRLAARRRLREEEEEYEQELERVQHRLHQAELTATAERAHKERHLESLLHSFPDAHRAVLQQLHDANGRHLAVRSYDEVTSALSKAGFIKEVTPLSGLEALYQLRPGASEIVTKYFKAKRNQEAAARREHIRVTLRECDDAAKELLRLFGMEDPQSADEPLHPWLESCVYSAIWPLTRAGVLTSEKKSRDPNGTKRINLTLDAVQPVEECILGHPVARTGVLLDLNQIEARRIPYVPQSG